MTFPNTVRAPDGFGDGSPRWTIPRSPRGQRVRGSTPGPGSYSPRNDYLENLPCIPIRSRPVTSDETITSRHELYCIRSFPEIRQKTIGRRPEINYGPMSDAPPFYHLGPNQIAPKGITIGRRFRHSVGRNPGPGEYSPRNLQTTPQITLSKHFRPSAFPEPKTPHPGPASYTISREITSSESWKGAIRPLTSPCYDDEPEQIPSPLRSLHLNRVLSKHKYLQRPQHNKDGS